MSDPYLILGVAKNATQEEIKKAYRKLARKYHPDLNPGKKESEKKFKEISHANDLIGTEEARMKFDSGETDAQKHRQYEEQMNRQNAERESFYKSHQKGGRYSQRFYTDEADDNFIQNLFGGRRSRSQNRAGVDTYYKMDIEFKEAALGGEKLLTLSNGKKLKVKIPAGIENGVKMRFKGMGEPGEGNAEAGDAYIQVSIKPLEGFDRVGNDIVYELPISFIEAILGAELKVPTLDGEMLLKIPAGASTGTRLRVKGKGAGSQDKRGNQIVILKVVTPKVVSHELKAAVGSIAEQANYNPRV